MQLPKPVVEWFTYREPKFSTSKGRWVLGLIIACIGLAHIGLAVLLMVGQFCFALCSRPAHGHVVAMEEIQPKATDDFSAKEELHGSPTVRAEKTPAVPTYAPVFTFTDGAGKEHRVRSSFSSNPPVNQVGDDVYVLYLPWSPDYAQILGFWTQCGSSMILFVIGGGFFLFGSFTKGLSRVF